MFSHLSLSDSKSQPVYRTPLSNQAGFNDPIVLMVSTSFKPCTNPLVAVPSAQL